MTSNHHASYVLGYTRATMDGTKRSDMVTWSKTQKAVLNSDCGLPIRSAYSSSFGVGFYSSVFQTMHEEDFLWAKKITDEYRSIRKYFDKDFYIHGSQVFDPTSWAIFQYHDAETESGIVMAFRRSESPFDSVTVTLKGLTEGKKYTFRNLDDGTEALSGGELKILLPEKRSSVIFEYRL